MWTPRQNKDKWQAQQKIRSDAAQEEGLLSVWTITCQTTWLACHIVGILELSKAESELLRVKQIGWHAIDEET